MLWNSEDESVNKQYKNEGCFFYKMYRIQLLRQAKLDSSYVGQSVLWHDSKVYISWAAIKSYWYTVSLQQMILNVS